MKSFAITASAAVIIGNMQTEYRDTPLGIDVEKPRFSWQMMTTAGERGYMQTAYQVIVRDEQGNIVWDSQKVSGDAAVGISYEGNPLEPATRYNWEVTVWNQTGGVSTGSSWFETGLMDPDPKLRAWDGAKWIGGSPDDLVLYAPYQLIFNLRYVMAIEEGSTKASFIYGANDTRLMDRYKNIFQTESGKDESYIKLELDISALNGSGNGYARLNVYRAGYNDTDDPSVPLQSYDISNEIINHANKNDYHAFSFSSAFGRISISIDDITAITVPQVTAEPTAPAGMQGAQSGGTATVNLNPVGSGGNYIPFGMLCDMGFSLDPGQKAVFSELVVYNNRFPYHTLFRENLAVPSYNGIYATYTSDPASGIKVTGGKYVLDGGSNGLFIVADPSRNSAPMMRTEFTTAEKDIVKARLYIAARGIYEIFMNGERVGDEEMKE